MATPTAHDRPTTTGRYVGIVTPEAVVLEFAEAGLGSRSLAFLVDLAVRGGLLYGLFVAMGVAGVAISETVAVVTLIAGVFAALLVYPVVCETMFNGRTPGKMAIGLRVVTTEGAPVRFRHAAIRSALGMVDFLVGAGSIAILSALATRQSQRLGDLAAGTIVIRERQAAATSQPILFRPPPGWEPYAAQLDVSGLDDDAYSLVRSFLLRVGELRPESRAQRADDLATAVADRMRIAFPPGVAPEPFLIAVAAAYQARHGGPVVTNAALPPGVPPPIASAVAASSPVWQDEQPPAGWGTSPGGTGGAAT